MKKQIIIILVSILLLISCKKDFGQGGSGEVTSYFLDSGVEGIAYSCGSSDQNGTTKEGGIFSYRPSDCGTISFYVANMKLGSVADVSYPEDFRFYIPTILNKDLNETNDVNVTKISRFLQSLDDDNNATNGIKIDSSLLGTLDNDLTSLSISQIATILTGIGKTIIDEDKAIAHLEDTLRIDSKVEQDTIAPFLTSSLSLSINENSTNINTLSADDLRIDFKQSDINYTILNEKDGLFFDLDNRNLIFKTSPDYETAQDIGGDNIYQIVLKVADKSGNSRDYDINIVVNNLIDKAPILANSTFSLSENIAIGTKVGNITILNSGDSPITSFSIVSDFFSVNSSGEIFTKALINFENNSSYIFTVFATNTTGNSNNSNIIINIVDAPEPPIIGDTIVSLNENIANGTNIGNLDIAFFGDKNISSFTILGIGSNDFSIDTNGVITTSSEIDYERQSTYSLNITANSVSGSSNTVTLTLNVTDIAEPPRLSNTTLSVDENQLVGTLVGKINIDFLGDQGISSMTLTGTDSTKFTVDSSGNVFTSSVLNFENKQIYNLIVEASSNSGNSQAVNLTININDIAEPPILNSSSVNVLENEVGGVKLGNVDISFVGDKGITSYQLSGVGSDKFIVENNSDIKVALNQDIDLEKQSSYDLSLNATSPSGNSNVVNLHINVLENESNITIISAIYDNNNTTSKDDDRVLIYYNTNIDSSSLLSPNTDYQTTSFFGTNPSSVFEVLGFRDVISLGNDHNITQNTTISLAYKSVQDVNGKFADIYNIENIEFQKNSILQTGLSTIYSANDDASLHKGIQRNFTRDIAYPNTVTDNVNRLMWEDGDRVSIDKHSISEGYCSALVYPPGEFDDWRLPSAEEMKSLVFMNNNDPAINDNIFLNTRNSSIWSHWTSTLNPDNSRFRVYINMANGQLLADENGIVTNLDGSEANQVHFIRCVRDVI